MFRKTVSAIMLFLLVIGTLTLAFKIQSVKADDGTVYINADGSISPSTAPIYTADNITYTLTGNITSSSDGIVVEKGNIVLNGGGYTVTGSGSSNGATLANVSTVTVNNLTITNFTTGIWLDSSSSNSLYGNYITNNFEGILTADFCASNVLSADTIANSTAVGIYLGYLSSNTTLSGNNVTNNAYGITLYGTSGNTLSSNDVTANSLGGIELQLTSSDILSDNTVTANGGYGIWLIHDYNNFIVGNNVTANNDGISLQGSSNDTIYHNDFVGNFVQASIIFPTSVWNTWDSGYPSGGNYWSDYKQPDLFRGASQNVNGSDGIGDTPYVIDANNTDHYPLMGPYGATVNTGSNVTVFPSQDFWLIFQNVTAAGTVILNETLTVNAPALTNSTGEYYVINVTAIYSGNVTVILVFDGSNMTQQQKGNLTMIQYTPIVGDVQPPFGVVNMRDVAYMARHFGTNSTSPNWDPVCNLNGDGVVDMRDIALLARHFGFIANWVDITTYIDTTSNVIYGNTTHFSFIGIQ